MKFKEIKALFVAAAKNTVNPPGLVLDMDVKAIVGIVVFYVTSKRHLKIKWLPRKILAAKTLIIIDNFMYNLILITNILRILDEKGMTKLELTKRAGVSVSFLSDLINDNANPSLRIIESIAKALETPLPMLFEQSDISADERVLLTEGDDLKLGNGLVWKGAVLNEFQAYQVDQWDRANRALLAKFNKKTTRKK